MASYSHRDSLRDPYGPNGYFPSHQLSMSMPEASSGLLITMPTTTALCEPDSPTYSNSFCTPRTIAPNPGYMLAPPIHGYHSEEAYAVTGHSASARGRSWSGASTVSVDYSVASQESKPRSPYSFIEPGGQYRVIDNSRGHHTGGRALHSHQESSRVQENQELVPKQEGEGSIKTLADHRTYCPHEDCLGEDGSPKRFFSRKADVTRHYRSRHDIKYIDCPKRNCERKGSQGFTRRDHLTEHLRGFHMEKIAKRQMANTKFKRGEKQASEDSNGSNSSSDGLSPPDHGDESFRFGSGKQSMAQHIDQGIKQEPLPSSDEEGEDIFPLPAYEDYLSEKPTWSNQSKAPVAQDHHPLPMRQSNMPSQHAAGSGTARTNPHGLTFQPKFATSRMISASSAYTTHHHPHQHQHQVYSSRSSSRSSMMTPLYATTSGMDAIYAPSSMTQPYSDLPSQPIVRYRHESYQLGSLDDSDFVPIQE
ncbi:hypothetical protein AYL99_07680 [Fonsecaea erecta]|uniref:C2H2-type domain-containing protein n=1 Tax=Fonsecaea erecta TaxID=1367422 RepID=A0A178ZFM7_9EURO|nr:hypothetical protein AYL99_07680 [Fonsecaea erecta]OAP58590.1 hypothetical protein AYL99_07680 [Fonsecaea erecta]